MTKIYETAKISDRTVIFGAENSHIGDFCFVSCMELHMAEGSHLGRFVEVQGRGNVYLGKGVAVGSHSSLMTSTDTPWGRMSDYAPESERRIKTGDIEICDEAFIGAHSTIMPGVTIGEGAVVGAYSYVSHDVQPWLLIRPWANAKVDKRRTEVPSLNEQIKRRVPDLYVQRLDIEARYKFGEDDE